MAELKVLDKIDLSQFDRKPKRSEARLDKLDEDEIDQLYECLNEYHDKLDDEAYVQWEKYVSQVQTVIEERVEIRGQNYELMLEKEEEKRERVYRASSPSRFIIPSSSSVFYPTDYEWIDLGLPSRTLWANKNAQGFYQYPAAIELFAEYLPTPEMFMELREYCECKWDSSGVGIKGPNKNTLYLPALGWVDYGQATKQLFSEGEPVDFRFCGAYWSSARIDKTNALSLLFYQNGFIANNMRDVFLGFSVRPVIPHR